MCGVCSVPLLGELFIAWQFAHHPTSKFQKKNENKIKQTHFNHTWDDEGVSMWQLNNSLNGHACLLSSFFHYFPPTEQYNLANINLNFHGKRQRQVERERERERERRTDRLKQRQSAWNFRFFFKRKKNEWILFTNTPTIHNAIRKQTTQNYLQNNKLLFSS